MPHEQGTHGERVEFKVIQADLPAARIMMDLTGRLNYR